MITMHSVGLPYSDGFLEQMQDDVEDLATDYKKSGGRIEDVKILKEAARVIRMIRADNEAG